MLTAEGCALRRARLWGALPEPCDLLIVAAPAHLIYFADFVPSPFVFRTTEAGAILLLEPGRATLVADSMLGPFVAKAHVDDAIAPDWYNGQVAAPHRAAKLVEVALDRLAKLPGKRIGVELASVPAGIVEGLRAARPGVEIVDISRVIRPLRRSKDADEVEALKRSIRAGEAGHAAAMAQIQPGMTELDAYQVVQHAAIDALGVPAILYGDFASGPRTATEKGGPATSRVIEAGDLLLLDFSVIVDGYRGDFTNTFAVGRAPTPRQVELFEACVGALQAGEALLKPGTPAREVDAAVRAHFASLGLAEHFKTHSGHGLGLGHPEPPYFVPESDETLQLGDVVALEPGLYVEGVGGMRFERNYLVGAGGPEVLSNHDIRIDASGRRPG